MGGKSSPPPPDYTPMQAIGREQLDFAKQQYAEMAPLARQVAAQQMAAQQQQMRQAQDYYDYQQQTFRPLERGLVADASRFNTDAYKEGLARDAAAAAGRAFSTTQAASQRAQASMGVNPASGRAMSMANQSNLGLAAQRANAMTGARNQADQLGWARRMDVTGLGRNLAGASTAAYQGATGAGTAGLPAHSSSKACSKPVKHTAMCSVIKRVHTTQVWLSKVLMLGDCLLVALKLTQRSQGLTAASKKTLSWLAAMSAPCCRFMSLSILVVLASATSV